MFERMHDVLPTTPMPGPPDVGTPAPGLRSVVGVEAGRTFAQGLYRLHTRSSADAADQLVRDAYPDFEGRIACFGVDWLGRQLSLDPTRGTDIDPEVLLYDVGAGDALEIPVAFSEFHDTELVDHPDTALASDFFLEWLKVHPDPVEFDQCVGYTVPLFLGGQDEIGNLELIDLDVYWTLSGQLRVATHL